MRILRWFVLAVLVVAVVGFAGWYFFLKSDPKPPAAIQETPTAAAPGTLDGTWTVKPGNQDNFVGYRVTEKLFANVTESTATGRTDNVTGTMTIAGTTVSDITVTADLRDLKSDQDFRDGRLHTQAIESDKFPEAKFVLTQAITLPAVPTVGETVTVDATGDFTLHGVTKSVTITLKGRWDGEKVQVVGSLPIAFSDYDISAPTSNLVASVDDHGEMELKLFFTKA